MRSRVPYNLPFGLDVRLDCQSYTPRRIHPCVERVSDSESEANVPRLYPPTPIIRHRMDRPAVTSLLIWPGDSGTKIVRIRHPGVVLTGQNDKKRNNVRPVMMSGRKRPLVIKVCRQVHPSFVICRHALDHQSLPDIINCHMSPVLALSSNWFLS